MIASAASWRLLPIEETHVGKGYFLTHEVPPLTWDQTFKRRSSAGGRQAGSNPGPT